MQRLEWAPRRRRGPDTATTTVQRGRRGREGGVRPRGRRRRRRAGLGPRLNDGRYTRIAAAQARTTVAVDADAAVVEALYRALRAEGTRRSCRSSATSPTPLPAWAGAALSDASSRSAARPDLTLCLALVHHVAFCANVPVRSFLDWLADLETELVVEFPTRDDPMVQRLLGRKGPGANPDYDTDTFERALDQRWRVERREVLPSGTRILYRATPAA